MLKTVTVALQAPDRKEPQYLDNGYNRNIFPTVAAGNGTNRHKEKGQAVTHEYPAATGRFAQNI